MRINFDRCVNTNTLRACSEPVGGKGRGIHVAHVQEKRNPADTLLIGTIWVTFLDGEESDMGYLQGMI